MLLNEGQNDRYAGYFNINKSITSDMNLDQILSSTPYDKIWFGSDWHLWIYNKDTKKIEKNPNFNKIISNYQKNIKEDDIFIFLGDLVDDEFNDLNKLKEVISNLNGYLKILILGNNELQPESFYNEIGFDYIFYAYQWGRFTFSHMPLDKYNSQFNIHGHMHQYKDYNYQNVTYNNHIRIYTGDYDNKPINLKQIITKWNQGFYKPE